MFDVLWADILAATCFVLNLDRCADRLATSLARIGDAGFTNVQRYRGVDAFCKKELEEAWKHHGSPSLNPNDVEFLQHVGSQGCSLGHYGIWEHIIQNDIPYAVVFEDDVEFHKQWHTLAPLYWEKTPKDFDILYMGSQFDGSLSEEVGVVPVYCTHAYIITQNGARKLYDTCLRRNDGTWTIDSLLLWEMKRPDPRAFSWYVWNGTMHKDERANKHPAWAIRNSGLVFQDADFGTLIVPRT
jgi:GR25 family glycosyltransferase involved in LPS biosynthesis